MTFSRSFWSCFCLARRAGSLGCCTSCSASFSARRRCALGVRERGLVLGLIVDLLGELVELVAGVGDVLGGSIEFCRGRRADRRRAVRRRCFRRPASSAGRRFLRRWAASARNRSLVLSAAFCRVCATPGDFVAGVGGLLLFFFGEGRWRRSWRSVSSFCFASSSCVAACLTASPRVRAAWASWRSTKGGDFSRAGPALRFGGCGGRGRGCRWRGECW